MKEIEELLKLHLQKYGDSLQKTEAELLRRFRALESDRDFLNLCFKQKQKDLANAEDAYSELEQKYMAAEAKLKEAEAIFSKVKDLCNLICNSSPDTTIKGEIESKAFYLGHAGIYIKNLKGEWIK